MAVYACSDLHGQGELFDQIMNVLQPNDKLYFLGDAIDRCPDGWRIFDTLMNDPRVIYLKGNHEDMMYNTLVGFPHYNYRELQTWMWNGAQVTLDSIESINDIDYIKTMIRKIDDLPLGVTYVNTNGDKIIMTHSGYYDFANSNEDWYGWGDELVWDRSHFYATEWRGHDNEYIVHGHTPMMYLAQEITPAREKKWMDEDDIPIPEGAYWYCSGHKCDIDCGAHFTNSTVLLNLDTFESTMFYCEANA